MSKVYRRVMRKDGFDNHIHTTPDGKKTLGAIAKPAQSQMMNLHTHLYEHEGKTHETGPADDGDPGHTHETIIGESSAQQAFPKSESFGPRNDSEAFRIGREWVVRNDSGLIIARGDTRTEAERRAKALIEAQA